VTTSNGESLNYAKLAYDRTEIAETLYRWAAGVDFVDENELASAFTEDVIFNFSPAGKKLGLNIPVLTPRNVVVKTLIASNKPFNTSHTFSNIQATIDGDSATAKAYVMIQLSLPRESAPTKSSKRVIMMCHCYGYLVRNGDIWHIKHWTIDYIWSDGDLTALQP
jgi:hypothetical protein